VYGKDERRLVRYTFSGRAARAAILGTEDALTLLPEAETALSKLVPLDPRWRIRAAAMRFPEGLCAYGPFHHRTVDVLRKGSPHARGLHITGDYVRGVSIENCFRSSRECVERITRGPSLGEEASAPRRFVLSMASRGGLF
jgi:oxygen-dependent protoporphyrinogen oxidase